MFSSAPRRRRRGARVAALCAAICTCVAGFAPAAQAAPDMTDQGKHGPEFHNIIPGTLVSSVDVTVEPTGVNTGCKPTDGRNPIVLLHGMNSSSYSTWSELGPQLAKDGFCVYAPTYGGNKGILPLAGNLHGFNGLASISESYPEVKEYIEAVKQYTGSKKVDLVGYSLGGYMAARYAKEVGAEGVGTVITLAGVIGGTSMLGLGHYAEEAVAHGLSIDRPVDAIVGPVGFELLEGSPYIRDLQKGGVEVPGVKYVSISSRSDFIVTPLADSQFHGKDSQAIVLQDGCSQDLSDHLGIPYSPRALSIVRRSLGVDVPLACGNGLLISSDLSDLGSSNYQPDNPGSIPGSS